MYAHSDREVANAAVEEPSLGIVAAAVDAVRSMGKEWCPEAASGTKIEPLGKSYFLQLFHRLMPEPREDQIPLLWT